jgi:flagellin
LPITEYYTPISAPLSRFMKKSSDSLGLAQLRLSSGLKVNNTNNASNALNNTTCAIQLIDQQITSFGAAKSRLHNISDGLSAEITNKSAARSSLLEADIADELMNFETQRALVEISCTLFEEALLRQKQIAYIIQQMNNE